MCGISIKNKVLNGEDMEDVAMTKKDINPNSYYVSIERFKNLVNKLPDDGKVIIEVEKDYVDKTRFSLEEMDAFRMQGKVLVITCTTNV